MLIVDPAHNDTLYSRNADKLFLPASNMKVVTASVALAQLGPDFRFRTTFAARGPVRDGVLHGDLVVIGRGDPTVSDHMMRDAMLPLRAAAESLAAHGIHRITGHIVSGDDAFPDANIGFGWDWDDLGEPFAAGVDELMFNEGYRDGDASRRRAIGRGRSRHDHADSGLSRRAVARHDGHLPAVGRRGAGAAFDAVRGDLVVNGTVAPGDTATLLVALRDPATAYLYGLAAALRARGIALRPQPVLIANDGSETFRDRAYRGRDAGRHRRLWRAPGHAVHTALAALRDCHPGAAQAVAESDRRDPAQDAGAGEDRRGIGRQRPARGESQLTAWGVPSDAYVIRDGSGLSRHDYLSPATLGARSAPSSTTRPIRCSTTHCPSPGIDGTIADRMRDARLRQRARQDGLRRSRALALGVRHDDGRRRARIQLPVQQLDGAGPRRGAGAGRDRVRLASMTLGAR